MGGGDAESVLLHTLSTIYFIKLLGNTIDPHRRNDTMEPGGWTPIYN